MLPFQGIIRGLLNRFLILWLLWHPAVTEFSAAQGSIVEDELWRRAWQDSFSGEMLIRPPRPRQRALSRLNAGARSRPLLSPLPHPALCARLGLDSLCTLPLSVDSVFSPDGNYFLTDWSNYIVIRVWGWASWPIFSTFLSFYNCHTL